jgi:hypothetical protein
MTAHSVAVGGVVALALIGGVTYASQDKLEICHATGSEKNPWNVISVGEKSWPAHEAHGDKYPVPQGGCDAVVPPDDGGGTPPPPPPGGSL